MPLQQSPQEQDRSGYLSEDTVAALASAVGGAVSVLRISGPRSFEALDALTKSGFSEKAEPRKLMRATLRSPSGQSLDDALAVRFVGPASFTGEDCVELHLHGGSFVAGKVLETLIQEIGVRQALPGEFSFRAVRNGKLALTQAQAVADLIGATNESAVELALEKLSGTQNRLLTGIAEEMRGLAVFGEIGIDFSDQDVDEVSLPTLKKRVQALLSELKKLIGSYSRGSKIQDGLGVAFIGLPNAGKSSFFNSLLGEDRSIVSEIAGTTRDVVRERLTLRSAGSSVTLRLEDTAGLRPTEDQIEKIGVERSVRSAKEADLIVLVVDATSKDEDLGSLRFQWEALGRPAERTVGVITKIDLLPDARAKERLRKALAAFALEVWVETSAETGEGISESSDVIVEFCSKWTHRSSGEVLLTRLDHLQGVRKSASHLERALHASEIDLFAADVRHALIALSPVIGETLPDDILGQIFSNFCIGK